MFDVSSLMGRPMLVLLDFGGVDHLVFMASSDTGL